MFNTIKYFKSLVDFFILNVIYSATIKNASEISYHTLSSHATGKSLVCSCCCFSLLRSHKHVTHFFMFFYCMVLCATSFAKLYDHSVQYVYLQWHTFCHFQNNTSFTKNKLIKILLKQKYGTCVKKSSLFF